MNRSPLFASLLFICALFATARSDVPPDPGYVRHSASLTLETNDDLSDYRFFLESPMKIEEIKILKGEPEVFDGNDRNGAARSCTVWAVPRTTIGQDFGVSAPEKLEGMRDALKQGRMYGATKLLSHDFQTTIREVEKENWKDPIYRIEKNEKGLTAVLVTGGAVESKTNGNGAFTMYSTEEPTRGFWAAVIGGMLLTFSFIGLGAWALRRSKMKTVDAGLPTK